ncbi:MAG: antitoxin VapB family protein [Candidatus Bathyarchaeota archaeon]|nr:antitoxin VapB family protein [Candidatus Bathyarchaeota archaeon]
MTKTISLTEDAYELLKNMKRGNESFSDTIMRLAKRRHLSNCAGLWSDIPDEKREATTRKIREVRKRIEPEHLN